MKRFAIAIIAALSSFYAAWSWAQTGTPLPKGTLNGVINGNFPDNTTGQITPFLLRQGFLDVVSSMQQFGCVHNVSQTTSYTFLTSDYGCLVTTQVTSPLVMTLNLPAANSAGFNPWNAFVSNYGGGNATLVPAAGTIQGLSSFTLQGQNGSWVVSDGANYQIFSGSGGNSNGLIVGTTPIQNGTANGILYDGANNILQNNGPFVNTTLALPNGNGQWTIGSTVTLGAVIAGQGSTDDFQLQNSVGTAVMSVPTSSTNVLFPVLSSASTQCVQALSNGQIGLSGGTCGGSGAPGGSNTQVQFNTNSSFGGISGVTSDSAGITANTATVGNLTGSRIQFATATFTGWTTAQFAAVPGWLTASGVNAQTASIAGNLTAPTAQFSGFMSAGGASLSGLTIQTATFSSNLTGTTANFSSNLTANIAQFAGFLSAGGASLSGLTIATETLSGNLTGTTANFSGNLTAGLAQFTGQITGTSAVFQTMTINNLTPAGPNCLQETGGLVQATNAACGSGGGTPGGANTNVQFNTNGSFGGDLGFTYAGNQGVVAIVPSNSIAGLSITLGGVTTNTKALNIFASWQSAGVVYDAPLFMAITNSSSHAGSLLMDAQVGGASKFTVDPSGNVALGSGASVQISGGGGAGLTLTSFGGTGEILNDGRQKYTWNNNNSGSVDTWLYRDSGTTVLSVLGLSSNGNGGSVFRVYNSTDVLGGGTPANYERGIMDWVTTTNVFTIGTQNTGNGIGRTVAFVASNTQAMTISPTGAIALFGQTNPAANETYAVCAATGATGLTAGGQLFVDTTACLASSMMVKHNIAAFNDYGMTKLASLAEPLHAEHRLASAPVNVDPLSEALALIPVVVNYDTLDDSPQFSLIAQNACQVDERLCERTRDGSIRAFRPNAVISILVAAIQKQQAEIEELQRRVGR